jgi:hypothetical protein
LAHTSGTWRQHADALGKRVHELRMPLQHSLPPQEGYIAALDELTGAGETSQKLAALYEAILPSLGKRYRSYVDRTDALMDAPSVRIIERILADQSRMIREYKELISALPGLPAGGSAGGKDEGQGRFSR